jgi:NADPH-dependent curcumin reductase CurA
MQLIIQRARMEGFIIIDYLDRFPEAMLKMGGWVAEGKVKFAVDVVEGLEQAPAAINRLFTGENQGKLIVQVGEEPA